MYRPVSALAKGMKCYEDLDSAAVVDHWSAVELEWSFLREGSVVWPPRHGEKQC